MTGIIDRLEGGGWSSRQRDPADRRGGVVQSVRGRRAEMLRLLSGMNAAITQICSSYEDDELELIAGFLNRMADAGRAAAAGRRSVRRRRGTRPTAAATEGCR